MGYELLSPRENTMGYFSGKLVGMFGGWFNLWMDFGSLVYGTAHKALTHHRILRRVYNLFGVWA